MNDIDFELKLDGHDLVLRVLELMPGERKVIRTAKLSLESLKSALDKLYDTPGSDPYHAQDKATTSPNVVTREQNQAQLMAELHRKINDGDI